MSFYSSVLQTREVRSSHMLSHLPGEKSPLTSSTAHITWGKGDDGKVLLTLSSVSKLVYILVYSVKCWKLSLVTWTSRKFPLPAGIWPSYHSLVFHDCGQERFSRFTDAYWFCCLSESCLPGAQVGDTLPRPLLLSGPLADDVGFSIFHWATFDHRWMLHFHS